MQKQPHILLILINIHSLIYKQVHVLLITSSENKRYSFAKKTRLESASDRTLQAGQSRKLSIYHLQ